MPWPRRRESTAAPRMGRVPARTSAPPTAAASERPSNAGAEASLGRWEPALTIARHCRIGGPQPLGDGVGSGVDASAPVASSDVRVPAPPWRFGSWPLPFAPALTPALAPALVMAVLPA